MSEFSDVLARLAAVIESRKGGDPEASYVSKLFAKGDDAILKKVGEEAVETVMAAKKLGEEAIETVIAATQGRADALASESADLIYHWLVVLAAAGVSLDDVADRLKAREGFSGLDEKAGRSA